MGKNFHKMPKENIFPPFEGSDVKPDISNDTISREEQMYFWSFFHLHPFIFAYLPSDWFTRRIKEEDSSKAPPDKKGREHSL